MNLGRDVPSTWRGSRISGEVISSGPIAPPCHHVALLTPAFLLRLGLSPQAKVLDLKERVRYRGCGARGRAVVSIKWRRQRC
jgi:hypothetical protein